MQATLYRKKVGEMAEVSRHAIGNEVKKQGRVRANKGWACLECEV